MNPRGKEYEEIIKDFVSRLFKEGVVRKFDHAWVRKDGSLVDIEINVALLKDDKGNITGAVGSIRDITEHKKATEEIKKFKTIADRANYGVAISDLEGNLTYINEFFAAIHGYTTEEIIGKNLSIFHTEKQMKHVNELNEQLIHTGSFTSEEVWHKRKDNTVFPTLMSATIVKDEKDKPLFLSATAVDISEYKFSQKKLIGYQDQLRSLASQLTLTEEQERRKFAESLHDYIGQSLFISKIKLETLQKSGLPSNSAKTLDETLKLIEQMINDTRSLTFELSPPILYQLGFEPALEWLIEQTGKQYGIRADFEDDKQLKPLDDDISILLFRAVRELLINVVKHAQAQNVKVSTRRDGGKIQICVEDDGIGFTLAKTGRFDLENKRFGLFSIKERLDQLGGHFKMESTPHHGTRMTIETPLKLQE